MPEHGRWSLVVGGWLVVGGSRVPAAFADELFVLHCWGLVVGG